MNRIAPNLLPEYVRSILFRIENHGFEAYIVGGCVRDLLLSRRPSDWDICTSALPENIKSIFRHTADTGIKHGTVSVFSGGGRCEVTTYRTDGEYDDCRHPRQVKFVAKLECDLARRDFTMNAIACDASGRLFDPFNGINDISNGIIRCVGQAKKRFSEDSLRMLRAYRFSAQLGFRLDSELLNAIAECSPLVSCLSAERIRDELIKVLLSPHPETVGKILAAGLMNGYFPSFDCGLISYITKLPKKHLIRFYVLCSLYAVSPSDTAKKLRFSAKDISDCSSAEVCHIIPCSIISCRQILSLMSDSASLCLAAAYDAHNGAHSLKLMKSVIRSGGCYRLGRLEISGNDLAGIGLSGRDIGRVLKILLDYVIRSPELNTRGELIELAHKIASSSEDLSSHQ